MRILAALSICLVAAASQAQERAGDFAYYVLALSWSPSWCAARGEAEGAPQCDRPGLGFVVHGLWPQGEDGWPEYCRTDQPGPTRGEARAMADVMGSAGLAAYQWRKHGRCTGLDGAGYFAAVREAWAQVLRPAELRAFARPVRIDPAVVEAAFLDANPAMSPDGVSTVCRDGRLIEVRICLDRSLAPTDCRGQVARDCSARSVVLPPAGAAR